MSVNDGLITINEYNTMNNNIHMNLSDLFYYDLSGDLSGTYIYNEDNNKNNLPRTPPVQKRVADIIIAHAIQSKESCPITMDPIDSASACVSPCYHCFQAEAIRTWLSTESTCPVCREACTADKAK
jgi:SUMO ligase MMS21 Smc5/6 complex component